MEQIAVYSAEVLARRFEPTYHDDYARQMPMWDYLNDLYIGSSSWLELSDRGFEPTSKTQKYLPQHPAESAENWRSRINSTHFDDLFAAAIRRFVGMIFKGGLNLPESVFKNSLSSIDLVTGNGEALISALAIEAMKLGHTYVLIDYPDKQLETYKDFLGMRPYWIQISPLQLIDWVTEVVDGRVAYTYALVKVLEGSSVYYYEYSLVGWNKYLEVSEDGKIYWVWIDGGDVARSRIPLVPLYGGLPIGVGESIPPLKAIADKNRSLYQLTSSHYRKIALCCQPVPVLKDLMREQGEALVIGPNSFIQLQDPNGSFTWQEPLALSLEQSRRDLADLRESIARDSADFLSEPADRQSASATNLLTHPVEASLGNFIRTFQSGVNDAIALWYELSELSGSAQVSLEANVFPDSVKDSQALFAIQSIFAAELIDRQEAREMIKSLGWDLYG